MSESFHSIQFAFQVLRQEIMQFHFDYPLDIVPETGPKESLHYYLYSEKLSWGFLRMDPTGVPRAWGGLHGEIYSAGFIAWWGLINLSHFLRHHDEGSRIAFLKQVDWLEIKATVRADGSAVWPNHHDYLEGKVFLKPRGFQPGTSAWSSACLYEAIASQAGPGFSDCFKGRVESSPLRSMKAASESC